MSGNTTEDADTTVDLNASPIYPTTTIWVLVSAGCIFYMQAGFMLLEMGSVGRKNLRNAMVKTYLSICISAIMFYTIGYGLAFGDNDGKFGGSTMFAGKHINSNRSWCF